MLPQNDGNQSWYNLLNGTYKYYASEMQNGTGNITGGDTLVAIDNNQNSSRALRSLPLSAMMSGNLGWSNGNLNARGTYGDFWSSTPNSYTNSRNLYFGSASVNPKGGDYKPYGMALRCVARPSANTPTKKPIFQRRYPPTKIPIDFLRTLCYNEHKEYFLLLVTFKSVFRRHVWSKYQIAL